MAKQSIPSICLYGDMPFGYGLLVEVGGKIVHGNGELNINASLTGVLWRGLQALADLGHKGDVEVYAPGGYWVARVSLKKAWPYYGDLKWEQAKVYELSVDDILKAGGSPVILLDKAAKA